MSKKLIEMNEQEPKSRHTVTGLIDTPIDQQDMVAVSPYSCQIMESAALASTNSKVRPYRTIYGNSSFQNTFKIMREKWTHKHGKNWVARLC